MLTDKDVICLQVYQTDGKTEKVLQSGNSSTEEMYQIPRYQRPFSWGEEESYTPVDQLIDDIKEIEIGETYYLGSLVVCKKQPAPAETAPQGTAPAEIYEVIDGQQRLTTLFLLFAALGVKWKNLTYRQRPLADKTLQAIASLSDDAKKTANETEPPSNTEVDPCIWSGYKRIKQKLKDENLTEFKQKLAQVKLFRIEIEPNQPSDLNRYFEVMNTRGKQLEQTDMVKSLLMGLLHTKQEADCSEQKADCRFFADCWYACARMDGYIQSNMTERAKQALFNKNGTWKEKFENGTWKELTFDDARKGFKLDKDNEKEAQPKPKSIENEFRSIVRFPYFLLHVLTAYERQKHPEHKIKMDDQRLRKTVEETLTTTEDSKKFIMYLLRCRYLFDTYIIKRKKAESRQESDRCSLKKYNKNDKDILLTPPFGDTKGADKIFLQDKICMLQSCLWANSTGPSSMSWLTDVLTWFNTHDPVADAKGFEKELENHLTQPLSDFVKPEKTPENGTDTPHIAFHYLDYLLWKEQEGLYRTVYDDTYADEITKNPDKAAETAAQKAREEAPYRDFQFQRRNSVEHFYPQHPKEGLPVAAPEKLNHFGNLCLLTKGQNSRVSNDSPSEKIAGNGDSLRKQSMKFRYMQQAFEDQTLEKGEDPNTKWIEKTYETHGNEMFAKLKQAVTKNNSTAEKEVPNTQDGPSPQQDNT